MISAERPLISFTFDDFPRSALAVGGAILNHFGLAGTYYVCLGLLGREAPAGRIVDAIELRSVVEHGHELGCHTFSHCDSWQADTAAFEKSVLENRAALGKLLPGAAFRTFSYPISPPRPLTKAKMGSYFLCCRGGGQTFNSGMMDLNHLRAYFLEKTCGRISSVKDVIDRNRRARGWLIFATHDVCEHPTRLGCTPAFFEYVVKYAVSSGALILPVATALDKVALSKQTI